MKKISVNGEFVTVPCCECVKAENGIMEITIPLQKPTLSKSEKTLTVASTHGFEPTQVKIKEKTVRVLVNA